MSDTVNRMNQTKEGLDDLACHVDNELMSVRNQQDDLRNRVEMTLTDARNSQSFADNTQITAKGMNY